MEVNLICHRADTLTLADTISDKFSILGNYLRSSGKVRQHMSARQQLSWSRHTPQTRAARPTVGRRPPV